MLDEAVPERSGQTLTQRVMQDIRQRIASRKLTPGAKLPSIRKLAESLKVSKSTVVDAYDMLVAEGLIRSRKGSGFYVAGHMLPFKLAEMGPKLDRVIDSLWVSRQSLEAGEAFLMPGCGWLPASWMPDVAIRRAMRSLARADQHTLAHYGTPLGLPALRELICRRMANQSIDTSPDHVLLTDSGTQAIDLLCRFLLKPGDTVLVDDPCYFNFQALLKAHQIKIVSVPYTPHGPELDQFEKVLLKHNPSLYITNSGIHNPTGATLSPTIAHRILKLADQSDLTIIEDDIFGDFENEPAPRLAAFDGLDRVVYIGSFSKTISAAIRCGFIAARQDWIEALIDLKIATSFGGGPLAADINWRVLKDGSYRKHINDLSIDLSKAMGETVTRLRNIGIEPWIVPKAGMYLWCTLPEGFDSTDIAKRALEKNIILAPGNVFSHSGCAGRFLRFNVAQCSAQQIFTTLENLIQQ